MESQLCFTAIPSWNYSPPRDMTTESIKEQYYWTSGFEKESNKKERCCSRIFHIKLVTWFIAILQLFLACAGIICGALIMSNMETLDRETKCALVLHWLEIIIWLPLVILLIAGLWNENPKFVAAHMMSCIIIIVATIIQFALIFIGTSFFYGIIYCSCIVVFLAIVSHTEWRCYCFMERKRSQYKHRQALRYPSPVFPSLSGPICDETNGS